MRKKKNIRLDATIGKSERSENMVQPIAKHQSSLERIAERTKEIIENTENVTHMTIITEYHFDEVPSIRYNITENIVPKESED